MDTSNNRFPFGRRKPNRPEFHTVAGINRRLIDERRGQGERADYKPYITVQDFSSSGKRAVIYMAKVDRGVHFMSRTECLIGLGEELDDTVVDIKEQFPLPLDATIAIADALGIKPHPRVGGVDVVVTTDLLVTYKGPTGLKKRAIAVKQVEALLDRRVVAKLEIERAYHEAHGTEFVLMTEDDIHRQRITNWQIIRLMLRPGTMSDISTEILTAAEAFMQPQLASVPWGRLARSCDTSLQLAPGTAARIARYLMATRCWRVDLDQPFRASKPLPLLLP